MQTQKIQLFKSLEHSVQIIADLYRLIKVKPDILEAYSVFQWASQIQALLKSLYEAIPQMCAPISLFKKLQAQNLELSRMVGRYQMKEKNNLIEISILQDRLRYYQKKDAAKIEQINQNMKIDHSLAKKSRSNRQTQINTQAVSPLIVLKKKADRKSLPRLDMKGRSNDLNINWEINPSAQTNKRLIDHLMNK